MIVTLVLPAGTVNVYAADRVPLVPDSPVTGTPLFSTLPLDAVTVTEDVFALVWPLTLSVTVSVTLYVPAAAYVWLGLAEADVPPSPNVHACVPIVPPASVELSVNVAVNPLVVNVKFAVGVPPLPGAV